MGERPAASRRGALPSAVALLLAAGAVAPPPANASPMEDPAAGGAVFTGPTQPHATSIFLNPAALGLAGRGKHVYLGGTLRLDTVDIDRQLVEPDGNVVDGPSVGATTWTPGTTLAIYASVLDERAVIGAALHAPFSERFIAGEDALRYHVRGGYTYQALLSAAGGFRLAEWMLFGLGVSLGYSGFRLELSRDTALEAGRGAERGIASDCGGAPCGIENPQAAEEYVFDVTTGGLGGVFQTYNVGATVGVAFQVKKDWWTALSYVSPPGALLDLELTGETRMTAAPRDGGQQHAGRAHITYRMPQSVWLGLRGPVMPGYDLVASARWQNLSRHQQLDIRTFGGDLEEAGVPEWYPRYRGMRDVWQLSGGLEGHETGRLRLGGRVRLETGAVDARDVSPLQVSGLSAALAGGVEVRLAQHWVIQGGYDLTWFPSLEAGADGFDPIARLDCVDSGYDFDECRAAREGRALPTAAGSYARLRHGFSLSLRYDSL